MLLPIRNRFYSRIPVWDNSAYNIYSIIEEFRAIQNNVTKFYTMYSIEAENTRQSTLILLFDTAYL